MRKMATCQLETLGVDLALRPMDTTTAELPAGPGCHYEPKWDGFRCLAFRAGGEVEIKGPSLANR